MQPKISVIVPIYGVEKYLREAVDSILNQTLKDLEIILIDDGGKDLCPQIIDEYAAKDSRVVAIHKPNGGYGQTCNVGLERATGEYIAIMEPDDYIDENMYQDLYNIAKENNSDIVKSKFYENIQAPDKKLLRAALWDDEFFPKETCTINEAFLFMYYHPSIWSCIYRRDFLNENNIRFVEAPGAGWTDNPFQVQTMCLAKRINYTPKAYYYWRVLTSNQADEIKDYTIIFKRSSEIHNWLKGKNIVDKNVLGALYYRELAYICITMGMKKIVNASEYLNLVSEMINRMDENIISNFPYIANKDKKIYYMLKYHLKLTYFLNRLKIFRRNIITIKWNKKSKLIKIFNKIIVNGM